MKVNFKSTIIPLAIGAGYLGGVILSCNATRKDLNEKSEYVKRHNPEKYKELKGMNANLGQWYSAVAQVEADSIARANYAKGMQAVRDSIAGVNKNEN